jgi:predicted Zn-dependent peptidase
MVITNGFNAPLVDSIGKVSREDVQRVAKKYFGPRNRTVGILVPEPAAADKKE